MRSYTCTIAHKVILISLPPSFLSSLAAPASFRWPRLLQWSVHTTKAYSALSAPEYSEMNKGQGF